MITIRQANSVSLNTYWLVLDGLSTDTKPTHTFSGAYNIGNGSLFTEIDTGQKYMYDAENHQWWPQPVLVDGNEVAF